MPNDEDAELNAIETFADAHAKLAEAFTQIAVAVNRVADMIETLVALAGKES